MKRVMLSIDAQTMHNHFISSISYFYEPYSYGSALCIMPSRECKATAINISVVTCATTCVFVLSPLYVVISDSYTLTTHANDIKQRALIYFSRKNAPNFLFLGKKNKEVGFSPR